MNSPCIALVESNATLRDELVFKLSDLGYTTMAFADGSTFDPAITGNPPWAVAIIDLALPAGDGMLLCRRLRQASKSIGIMLLGHRNNAADRLLGQREGADNYLAKPVNMAELTAVVNVLTRRGESSIAGNDEWLLDDVCMTLRSPLGTKIDLTLSEVELVRALALRADHFADRDALIKSMGKQPDCYDPRALEVMVSRLRRKLGATAPLKAVRARGYVFAANLQFLETV
jgi:two-component system OmpR family response regulator